MLYNLIPETVRCMVVDHADGLHECVTDGGATELETALFQVLAHGLAFLCLGRHFCHTRPSVVQHLSAGELP